MILAAEEEAPNLFLWKILFQTFFIGSQSLMILRILTASETFIWKVIELRNLQVDFQKNRPRKYVLEKCKIRHNFFQTVKRYLNRVSYVMITIHMK